MLLYIHIPFCDSKCHYCSFNSYVDKFDQRERYIDALIIQFNHEIQRLNYPQFETLFIGGGTPTTVSVELYTKLFSTLQPYLTNVKEVTIEANPNSTSKEWLQGIKKLGITRLSFGVQSFNNEKLKYLGRAHKSNDAARAISEAKTVGFNHISLDLIYNTILDSKELLLSDIEQAFSLGIDHLSAYALTIENDTLFETNNTQPSTNEFGFFVASEIEKRGFKQYEISNFGTYESLHNKGYWELKPYVGIGSGAVGFSEYTRYYPNANIEHYIKSPTTYTKEQLSKEDGQSEL
jgi:oxygen-independent coproporphyrinogen-3 oxidase